MTAAVPQPRRHHLQTRWIFAAGLALYAGTANADELAQRGEAILLAQCANCHAIGKVGPSPLAKAPAFRDLHHKYDVAYLAEALAEGISTGHPEMPTFVFQPPEINAIITYLKSLEPGDDAMKP